MKRWWCISIHKNGQAIYFGKIEATEKEITDAVGPWHTVEGNHIVVFAPKKGS